MYIVIHRQTVSFYQNSSVWLDTQDMIKFGQHFTHILKRILDIKKNTKWF